MTGGTDRQRAGFIPPLVVGVFVALGVLAWLADIALGQTGDTITLDAPQAVRGFNSRPTTHELATATVPAHLIGLSCPVHLSTDNTPQPSIHPGNVVTVSSASSLTFTGVEDTPTVTEFNGRPIVLGATVTMSLSTPAKSSAGFTATITCTEVPPSTAPTTPPTTSPPVDSTPTTSSPTTSPSTVPSTSTSSTVPPVSTSSSTPSTPSSAPTTLPVSSTTRPLGGGSTPNSGPPSTVTSRHLANTGADTDAVGYMGGAVLVAGIVLVLIARLLPRRAR